MASMSLHLKGLSDRVPASCSIQRAALGTVACGQTMRTFNDQPESIYTCLLSYAVFTDSYYCQASGLTLCHRSVNCSALGTYKRHGYEQGITVTNKATHHDRLEGHESVRFNIQQLTVCSSCFCCCCCLVVALLLNNIEVCGALSRKDFPCRKTFKKTSFSRG